MDIDSADRLQPFKPWWLPPDSSRVLVLGAPSSLGFAQPHTPRDRSRKKANTERKRERETQTETQSCEARFAMLLAGRFPLPKSIIFGLAQSLGHGYRVHGLGFWVWGCGLHIWGAGVLKSGLHVLLYVYMDTPQNARKSLASQNTLRDLRA